MSGKYLFCNAQLYLEKYKVSNFHVSCQPVHSKLLRSWLTKTHELNEPKSQLDEAAVVASLVSEAILT